MSNSEFLSNHDFAKSIGASLLAASALTACAANPEAAPVAPPPDLCGKVNITDSPEGRMLPQQAAFKGQEMYSAQSGDYTDGPNSVRYTIADSIRREIQLHQYGLEDPKLPKDQDVHPGNIFEVCIDPKNPVNVLVEQIL